MTSALHLPFFVGLIFLLVLIPRQQMHAQPTIPDSLKKGADAVFNQHITEVDYSSPDVVTVRVTKEVTILNENGREFADFAVYYNSDKPIQAIEAHLYDGEGNKVKTYGKKEIKDISPYSESTLFDDQRQKKLEVYYPQYPYRVVFEYTQQWEEFIGLPHWIPQTNYRVGVEYASYRITFGGSTPIRYKSLNLQEPEMNSPDSGLKTMAWEERNLPPIQKETYGPDFPDQVKALFMVPECFSYKKSKGCFTNWGSYGAWVSELIQSRGSASREMKKTVEELVHGIEDPRKKVKVLYKYMQNHTRYVSIQLGLGGFQPYDAKKVAATGWGDCKALVNYTKTLLRLADIRSHYCEIGVKEKRILFDEFPSAGQTNHVVLAVPLKEDTLWLECTHQNLPFGYLPYSIQAKKVLWVDEKNETGYLVSTPAPNPKFNSRQRFIHWKLDASGNAHGSMRTTVGGGELRRLFPELWATPSKQQNILYNKYALRGFQLDDFSYELTESPTTTAREKIRMTVQNFATQTGKRLFLKSNILSDKKDIPKKVARRVNSVVIDRSYHHTDSIIIEIPEGYKVEYLPEGTDRRENWGHFSAQYIPGDQKITYISNYQINRYKGPPSEYNAFIDFLTIAKGADEKNIIFVKD